MGLTDKLKDKIIVKKLATYNEVRTKARELYYLDKDKTNFTVSADVVNMNYSDNSSRPDNYKSIDKADIFCHYCKTRGHVQRMCYKWRDDIEANRNAQDEYEPSTDSEEGGNKDDPKEYSEDKSTSKSNANSRDSNIEGKSTTYYSKKGNKKFNIIDSSDLSDNW